VAAVYISSTSNDLKEHRAAVRLALRKIGHVDIAMEYYVAESKRPLAKCLNDVMSCDLYIGIFAWRYGYVPRFSQRSITEKEFREAIRCDKSALFFLVAQDAEWPNKYVERGPGAQRLRNLRADIEAQFTVDYFSTPADLAMRVTTAVAAWAGPFRTPQDVEREHRLMKSWLYSREPFEKERARQALRNMGSIRYIAGIRQFLMDERGSAAERASLLADILALCGVRPETTSTLLDVLSVGDRHLKKSAIFQVGEIWLGGREAGRAILKLFPLLADTRDDEILYFLIHAIEKLIRTRRLGATDESVPDEIVECLNKMAIVPENGWHRPARVRHSLDIINQKKPFDEHI
jgi:hypothetical protein